MFSLARNGRRFKETVKVLDTKRSQKEVTETLTGLVQQSYDTAQEIKTVKDPVRKKELTVKLKNTLKEYRSVLKQYEESSSSPQSGSTFVTPSDNRNQQNQNRDQVNEVELVLKRILPLGQQPIARLDLRLILLHITPLRLLRVL